MKNEVKELIGKEDTLCNLSNEFIALGYSDMFDVGNIDECVEDYNCVSLIGEYNEKTGEYEEINVIFEIVEMCNKEENENHLDTLVRITDIEDL